MLEHGYLSINQIKTFKQILKFHLVVYSKQHIGQRNHIQAFFAIVSSQWTTPRKIGKLILRALVCYKIPICIRNIKINLRSKVYAEGSG